MPPTRPKKKKLEKAGGNDVQSDNQSGKKEETSTIGTNNKEDIDVKNKMTLAKYITQSCQQEMIYGFRYAFTYSFLRASFYTGMNRTYLTNIRNETPNNNTFRNFLSNINNVTNFPCKETYKDIRRILLQHYVYNNSIPTVKTLIKALGKDVMFILHKTGFIWTKLPNTNIKIVIEKPETFYNRMQYLKKIRHYRRLNRNIVYVRDIKLELQHKYLYITGISPKLEWSNFLFCEVGNKYFLRWLSEFLIPVLPPSSVIVIDHKMRDVIPTIYSPKEDLIKWLKVRDIPHDASMHKTELFSLVEKFKNNYKLHMDEVYQYLKGYGHDVLQVLPEMRELNYLQIIWDDFTKDMKDFTVITKNEIITNFNYTKQQLKKFESDLVLTEEKYYEEDIAMEEIIDKLKTLAKYGDITEPENVTMKSDDPGMTLDSKFIVQ